MKALERVSHAKESFHSLAGVLAVEALVDSAQNAAALCEQERVVLEGNQVQRDGHVIPVVQRHLPLHLDALEIRMGSELVLEGPNVEEALLGLVWIEKLVGHVDAREKKSFHMARVDAIRRQQDVVGTSKDEQIIVEVAKVVSEVVVPCPSQVGRDLGQDTAQDTRPELLRAPLQINQRRVLGEKHMGEGVLDLLDDFRHQFSRQRYRAHPSLPLPFLSLSPFPRDSNMRELAASRRQPQPLPPAQPPRFLLDP